MMSAFFQFQHTLNIFFNNCKGERGGGGGGGGGGEVGGQFKKTFRKSNPQKAQSY